MGPDTDFCQTGQPRIGYSVDFIAEQSWYTVDGESIVELAEALQNAVDNGRIRLLLALLLFARAVKYAFTYALAAYARTCATCCIGAISLAEIKQRAEKVAAVVPVRLAIVRTFVAT